MPPAVDVRRGVDRPTTTGPGRRTAHSFSFGRHYDPGNVGLGALVAVNDERLEPGAAYDDHAHRDVVLLTWVVDGVLSHRDPTGATTRVRPGQVQVQSAGAGIVHREGVDADDPPTRFVQCWLRPRAGADEPSYAVGEVSPGPDWTVLASGLASGPPGGACLDAPARASVARLDGSALDLPPAPRQHLLVTRGRLRLRTAGRAWDLLDGDAVRLTSPDATDPEAARVTLDGEGEVLRWDLEG